MALKENLLVFFSLHPDIDFSAGDLAETCRVSVNEIHEAVKEIRADGFAVTVSAAGEYCFSGRNDILSAAIIAAMTPEISAPVYVFQEIGSTNNYAHLLAENNCPPGTTVIANHQTAGRGRQGHSFYSPKDTGLYFSMVVRFNEHDDLSLVTPAAAVAAAAAIRETTGIRPGIKWVNDLFIGRRKAAGILCEGVMDRQTGRISTGIIGIGINCRTEEFPDDIQDIAVSLHADTLSRNRLAAVLRRNLLYYTSRLEDPELMELYRRDSVVIGKHITYTYNNETLHAFVTGINDRGNLILRKDDGSEETLMSGEISIKDWLIP